MGAITRASEHHRRLAEGLAKSGALAAFEAQRTQLAKIDFFRLLPNIDTTRIAEIARRFHEEYERAFPPNWVGLEIGEVMAVIDCVEATGFALVWIPRVEIVRKVLNANEDEITEIMLARRDDILDDAVAVLVDVTCPELLLTRRAVEESIAVLRDGYHLNHNTAHRITPEQWCERNALSAVILATALLREVECWDGVNGVDIN
jgi:hypothetical protein